MRQDTRIKSHNSCYRFQFYTIGTALKTKPQWDSRTVGCWAEGCCQLCIYHQWSDVQFTAHHLHSHICSQPPRQRWCQSITEMLHLAKRCHIIAPLGGGASSISTQPYSADTWRQLDGSRFHCKYNDTKIIQTIYSRTFVGVLILFQDLDLQIITFISGRCPYPLQTADYVWIQKISRTPAMLLILHNLPTLLTLLTLINRLIVQIN